MMKAIWFLAAVCLGGCAAKPELLRHYARQTQDTSIQSFPQPLELSVFATVPKANESTLLVSGLSERAQAELIRSLATQLPKNAAPADLVSLIAEPHESKSKSCAWADRSVLTRRVTITLLGELPRPADRVDRLEVSLRMAEDAAAMFTSWDRFDSVFGSFNIGTATFTQSSKLNAALGSTQTRNIPNSGGSGVSLINVGGETTNELAESAAYALRRLSVGGALDGRRARLVQEGGPYVNLFGTSTATVSLRLNTQFQPVPVYSLGLWKEGKPVSSDNVSIERCQGLFPSSNQELTLAVQGTATVRRVLDADNTVPEGDDIVAYSRLPLSGLPTVLVTSEQLDAQVFALLSCKPGERPPQCAGLEIELQEWGGNADQERVSFASPAAAGAFRAWLVEQTKGGKTVSHIGGRRIGVGLNGLRGVSKVSVAGLQVGVIWRNSASGSTRSNAREGAMPRQ